jgi:hypothetical protein
MVSRPPPSSVPCLARSMSWVDSAAR